MILEAIATTLPVAVTDDPGMLATILAQVWLWTKVAIGIGLVIFVHELGHFSAAKMFGVKCEKFYVGFDVPIRIGPIKFPRTLGKFQYGETEYGIGILPLGGYVKMLGQDDDPRKAEAEAERIRLDEGRAGDGEGADDEGDAVRYDPRSYPAKPVWQRMVIISAGVVMNVITGVLFAALAYGFGVPYTPAVVGGVTAGGPAWQAGLAAGGQVVAVGSLPEDRQLHFEEMRLAIMTEGMDQPDRPVNVSIRYGDELREYRLQTQPHPAVPELRMIGISSPASPTLGTRMAALPGSAAATVVTAADLGATVTAFDGTSIDPDHPAPMTPLFDRLHRHPDRPVRLSLLRTDGSSHEVELPPQPAKSVGLEFQIGPITALVAGGPAESAGVRVGDRIVAIGGEQEIDAYTLALEPVGGTDPVTLTVLRGDGEDEETLEVELMPADTAVAWPPTSDISDEIASTTLGLAYRPLARVARVRDSAGEPDLRPGDVLQEASVRTPREELAGMLGEVLSPADIKALSEGWEFGNERPLTRWVAAIQTLPEGTEVRVLARRPDDGKVIETVMTVRTTDRHWYDRGLMLLPSESIQTAGSVTEAMALGYREGKRRLGDVFRFLGMIVQGKVSPKHVGGPVRIVQLAGDRAEQGVSKQLLFLTLLSMNLAILNFLPIPALDGGHMVFLTYELVRGKRVDEQLEMRLTMAGILALLALMIFVFANDIIHI